ncbi:pimeloyl-ACP methyl ester carboxylesterase [Kribbella voronezhensis]|uniref:Pimeloyl-ACP methyl ester carboxylesterase n=1 Tax=Kribbella voronezhensis TaxID=2512212 RepID=A0A4V3FJR9_9ACTN|nr:alpha/beta hydrolase [Kribbella voronezhensis]TDU87403.1 pimeloyl-ACP methyl ester carboxylesterase [Kribbella voronezhensis]
MILRMVRAGLQLVAKISPALAGRLAFELWRRPLMRGKVREPEQAIHAAAKVEVIDGVVTYQWGDGTRPVLLVHGWRSRASRFAAYIERLLELGYSPISYDAPAHGDSGGGRIASTILDHQRIIQALAAKYGTFEGVIAHSLGAPFALYAVREGVAANRLVTVSGVADFGYLTDAFCHELGLGPAANQALRKAIERHYFPGLDDVWTRFSVRAGDLDLLVIHNDEDDVVDPGQAEVLLTQYGSKARFLQTKGLGHRRIMIDPDVITEAVAFLTAADLSDQNSDVAERLDLGA